MKIGELAKQAGVNVQTVRFYERQGLLPEPPRRESGYRIYSSEDLRRLRFIRQAKFSAFRCKRSQQFSECANVGDVPAAKSQGLAKSICTSWENK